MTRLREVHAVQQVPGEPRRRWFSSTEIDLIVWLDAAGAPAGFQLCYGKPHAERALTWRGQGYVHAAVDTGEDEEGQAYKRSPILVADGVFEARSVAERFDAASADVVPDGIREFVAERLREHPEYGVANGR